MKIPTVPPPTSFAEGQRLIYGCLVAGAGMFCGGCSVAMVALLMWGGWAPAEQHSIVIIFGWSLGGFISAMTIVIIGLLVGGPVGRFKGNVGRSGLDFEASGNEPSPSTVAAAAAGAVAGAAVVAKPPEGA